MPLVRREGQQRIVPDHAVESYRQAGWDDGQDEPAVEPEPAPAWFGGL